MEESIKFEFQSKQNVLEERGVFKTGFRFMTPQEQKKKFDYSFSMFQIPTLVVDYLIRKNTDSLKQFILEIPQNSQQFSNVKMKMQTKEQLSILLKDF